MVGDGAPWIWNLVGTYLYDAHQVVDWYHATEHLAIADHLAFGEGTSAARHWLKQQETPLFQGHADRVAQTIISLAEHGSAKEELLKQAGYFTNHYHRMQYLEMRSEGWLIGSGMVPKLTCTHRRRVLTFLRGGYNIGDANGPSIRQGR